MAYLSRHHDHSTEAEWRARIADGSVLLDDSPCRPESRLRRGQLLVWRRPPWVEPAVPAGGCTLYRDEHLLAVEKPAGLPVLPGGGFLENTLLHRVREIDPRATPMHRLGRYTSGLVLFALSARARTGIAAAFRNRQVHKRYRALAAGDPAEREFAIERSIGPVPHALLGTVHGATPTGRQASSRVRVLECRRDAFLADVFIVSGRPHQIRIHLAAAGHPLVGDPLYGPGGIPVEGGRSLPGDPGYRLHAAELGLAHPVEGRHLELRSVPPAELLTRRETAAGRG